MFTLFSFTCWLCICPDIKKKNEKNKKLKRLILFILEIGNFTSGSKNMLGIFRKLSDFLIYSNLYIAIAAVLMTVQSQIQLGITPSWHPYLFLILFATLFEYNLHKFVGVFFYKHSLDPVKFGWITKNLKLFYMIFVVSVSGFVLAALFAQLKVLLVLFPLGIITFLYSFPVYKKGIKIFRLREVPLVKIFIISFVWSATCVLLPLIQSGKEIEYGSLLSLIFERFLFVFAITVPFDIRDMEGDKKAGLKTLPLLLGAKRSIAAANIAMVIFMIMIFSNYGMNGEIQYFTALMISGISTLFFLNSSSARSHRLYHYGILDGTMIIQALLVMFCYYFQVNF
jgi:4-hydroxybenzoate polyprenyltransferase